MKYITQFIALITLSFCYTLSYGFSSGITGYSGADSDGETCSFCHFGGTGATVNNECSGDTAVGAFTYYNGSITTSTSVSRGLNSSVSYSMDRNTPISLANPSIGLGGMGAKISGGSFSDTGSVTVDTNITTATHRFDSNTPNGSGNISWTWNWTSPTTPGSYSLSICGNPTNGGGSCASDGPHEFNTCKATSITVFNNSPSAIDDGAFNGGVGNGTQFLTVSEDASATNTLSVLTNDTDIDIANAGDVISVISFSNSPGAFTTVGSVTNNGNNTFAFNPNGQFESLETGESAVDRFQYTIDDDQGVTSNAVVFVEITGVSDAPVITESTPQAVSISEDNSPTAFALTLNATDAEDTNSTLTWTISAAASNGSASVAGTGASKAISYTPNINFIGSDSFDVRVTDSTGRTDTLTVDVTVGAVNDAPAITEGATTTVAMDEDAINTAFSLTLNATDTDNVDASLTWTISSSASNGTASVTATAAASKAISYTPTQNFNGTDEFTVRVSDGSLFSEIVVTVNISPVADNPVIAEGATTTVNMSEDSDPTAFSLTLNATDADNDTLTWSISSNANNGSATVSGSGPSKVISYTPNLNHTGVDTFTVLVTDNSSSNLTASIIVNVTLAAVNDKPIITEGETASVTMDEDSNSTPFSLTLNASDPEGDTITWSVLSNGSDGTAAVSITPTGTSQVISYNPDADFNGTDSFIIRATSTALTDDITVTVTINAIADNPVITEGNTVLVSMSEDSDPTAFSLTLNATDAENDTLTWSISSNASDGTASVTGTGASKAISYAPNLNFTGTDNFTVLVTDNSTSTLSSSIVVTVNVSAVNDAPVITEGASASVTMDEDSNPTPFALTLNAIDLDGDTINWSVLSNGSDGTAAVSVTTTGTSQVITYTPNADFNGSDSFIIRAGDTALTDDISVNVTVNAIADSPVITEGVTTTVNILEDAASNEFGLTLNATDGDNDTLTWTISSGASHGTASVSGTGSSKAISYAPDLNYTGSDSFTVLVTDDSSSTLTDSIIVNVNISEVSDPPMITEGITASVIMDEDSNPAPFILTLNASDPDGDTINWSVLTNAGNGTASVAAITTGTSQVISYIPNANFNGMDSFVIRVDAAALSDDITVNVTVNAVADNPVITQGNAAVSVSMSEDSDPTAFALTLNATDGDNDTLTWSISSPASHGTASVSGTGTSKSISYVPNLNINGTDSFTVLVTDNSTSTLTDSIVVNVAIAAVNDSPVITQGANTAVTIDEDSNPTPFSLTLNATDVDGDTLNWSVLSNGSDGTAAVSVTTIGTSQVITYTPNAHFNGSDSFIIRVEDSALTNDISVNVTINAIADSPVITQGNNVSVNMSEDSDPTPFSLTLNATDGDNDTLTWSISNAASDGTASVIGTGASKSISYVPNANVTGADSFTVLVTDNSTSTLTDSIIVNVSIGSVNDAPIITEGALTTVTMDEDANPTAFSLTLNATDADGDTINWSVLSNSTDGTASISATVTGNSQLISYLPNINFNGSDSFVIRAESTALSDDITVNVNVTAINDAPVITEGATVAVTMSEDSNPTAFNLTLNATDIENNTLTWSISGNASNGVAAVTGSGLSKSIAYTPTLNFTGNDSFVVSVSDGFLTDTITVNVTIQSINDAPTIVDVSPSVININEDAALEDFNLTLNATDTEADVLTWRILAQATNGVASTIGTGNSKKIDYQPNADFNGNDTFTVEVSDGTSTDSHVVNVNIAAINDTPILGEIASQTVFESNLLTVNAPVFTDIDIADLNDGNGSVTWSISNGLVANSDMAINNVGVFTWTPAETGTFNDIYNVTISVQDGLENGVTAVSTSFTITVNPIDTDSDGIPDYDDLCPITADSTNADNDKDGTAGEDELLTLTQGGDVCDSDDDNDGMPDQFEIDNGFDPFNSQDADEDFDGDGISNKQEFDDQTDPKTGSLVDVNIDSTGYLTSHVLVEPDFKAINPLATAIATDNTGPYETGVNVITWTLSNATNSNLLRTLQNLNVKPIINFDVDQLSAEGATARVFAQLNGQAVIYPVIINYTVSGTSDSSDHNAVNGSMSITEGIISNPIDIEIVNDATTELDETIIVTMASVSNAVIGAQSQHMIVIKEGNVAPSIDVSVTQVSVGEISTAYIENNTVTVTVIIDDANKAQTHSINWSSTDNALSPPVDNTSPTWTFEPSIGTYQIEVTVTDNDSEPLSATITKVVVVSNSLAPVLRADIDSDGDGTSDLNEGYDDVDTDGIPDYLDALNDSNLIADQTSNQSSIAVLQTETGLKITLGLTAIASETAGTALTDQEITSFGGSGGNAVLNSKDDFDHIGGIYDFEISGMIPGSSTYLIIPLQVGIPNDPVYRKYTAELGWTTFISDGVKNQIYSAKGSSGACPDIKSDEYTEGLTPLNTCIQLLIEDGGVNDQDKTANGRIVDPGTISTEVNDVEENVVKSGGGQVPLGILLFLTLIIIVKHNLVKLK